jgi:hypothetical protein
MHSLPAPTAASSAALILDYNRICRLPTLASVAIEGSKCKAVHNRDKNFTRAKMDRRLA